MPEILSDADRIFIAQWAREIIKAVFTVGALLSTIVWGPAFLSYLRPGDPLFPPAAVAAVVTLSCMMAIWNAHRNIRSAEKTLARFRDTRRDNDE